VSDPVAPSRRKPSILLIVSLCLNLALIGLGAVMFFRFPPPSDAKNGLSAGALMRMVPAEQSKIQAVIEAHRGKLHALRQQALAARVQLFDVLSAQAFDKDAFAKATTDLEAADVALEAENLKTTADAVALLTPDERAQVASGLRKPNHPWYRRMFRQH
jgi:uncharacterized membrane protein